VALAMGEHTIGRASDVLVSLPSSRVSRRHACVRVADSGVTIEDLGSKNGTYVGEQPIDGPVALHDGDRVTIGPVLLIFRALGVDPTTSTQASAG
jgi:pSer/pThr/pTyr-binding forkhead associated (FHA) protein